MSMTSWWVIVGLIALAMVVIVAWRGAVRIDGLHKHVIQARAGLDALLVRRAYAALQLANSEILDPASAGLIARAANDALSAGPQLTSDKMQPSHAYTLADTAPDASSGLSRAVLESQLTQVLRATLTPMVREQLDENAYGRALVREVDRASQQVAYARRFHNDHVARARSLRSHLIVKIFCLAGKAPLPEPVDIDDSLYM